MTVVDPYTTAARLCDDAGMVSDAPVSPRNEFDPELTYLKQLDNLRAHTGLPPYQGAAFACTGSAHLAREHIRCTSTVHFPNGLFARAARTNDDDLEVQP